MTKIYPFLDRLRAQLKTQKKELKWLASEIDKTDRWFYTISEKDFGRLELGVIEQISRLVDFNFVDDYNIWKQEQHQEPLFIVNEPAEGYKKKPKLISINFKISSTLENAEENSGKVLNTIRMDCEKYGYEFELL